MAPTSTLAWPVPNQLTRKQAHAELHQQHVHADRRALHAPTHPPTHPPTPTHLVTVWCNCNNSSGTCTSNICACCCKRCWLLHMLPLLLFLLLVQL
jgi:hypothetical protein